MNKLLEKINTRNIQELYQIKDITDQGVIILKNKSVSIYKIDPTNIVACDDVTKLKIHQAYTSCIRGLPDTFQIIVAKEKTTLQEQIKQYKVRLTEIESEGLKIALKKYIEYLENINELNTLYKTNHYLIVENLNSNEMEDILGVFSNLKEFGIKISKVKSSQMLREIIRKYIMKEANNEML